MIRNLIIFAAFLTGCAAPSANRQSTTVGQTAFPFEQDASGVRYVDARDRQLFFSIAQMQLYVGPTAERYWQLFRRGDEVNIRAERIWDCSNENFSCLRDQHFVFAVPLASIRSEQSYSAEGLRFVVRRCHDAACAVAEIAAICERRQDGACALSDGQPSAPVTMALFTFDRVAGVTAIELGPDPTGRSERRKLLVGDRGILASSEP